LSKCFNYSKSRLLSVQSLLLIVNTTPKSFNYLYISSNSYTPLIIRNNRISLLSLTEEISIIVIYLRFPFYLTNIYLFLLNIIIFEFYFRLIADFNLFILQISVLRIPYSFFILMNHRKNLINSLGSSVFIRFRLIG
jgi:hypothetical protein